jgi:electron transfer flavoprotein alpha subunit
MKEIFVIVEHRQGVIRDISFELLMGGAQLADNIDGSVTAVLLGSDVGGFVAKIEGWANKVLVIEDGKLENFNSEAYQKILVPLIQEYKPYLTLIAQSGFGTDLAPSLAVALDYPLTTDCYYLEMEEGSLVACRQMYGGKVNARIRFGDAPNILCTIRAGSFPPEGGGLSAEVVKVDCPLKEDIAYRKFIEYVEAVAGDVDITQADIVVGVGRGIKEKENIPIVQELADAIGGVVACSRPIVDAGWFAKDRQVGSSGKTIKPKLYIAVGISGAFQHTAGMKGAETIVAINKDCNAPIFGIADYGIVGDLMKVVPALKEKIKVLKAS